MIITPVTIKIDPTQTRIELGGQKYYLGSLVPGRSKVVGRLEDIKKVKHIKTDCGDEFVIACGAMDNRWYFIGSHVSAPVKKGWKFREECKIKYNTLKDLKEHLMLHLL